MTRPGLFFLLISCAACNAMSSSRVATVEHERRQISTSLPPLSGSAEGCRNSLEVELGSNISTLREAGASFKTPYVLYFYAGDAYIVLNSHYIGQDLDGKPVLISSRKQEVHSMEAGDQAIALDLLHGPGRWQAAGQTGLHPGCRFLVLARDGSYVSHAFLPQDEQSRLPKESDESSRTKFFAILSKYGVR